MSDEVTSVGAGGGPPLSTPGDQPSWPLIGHAREVGFLQQAIRGNRVAHAYLFVGASGSG
jgi:hypothetical protein